MIDAEDLRSVTKFIFFSLLFILIFSANFSAVYACSCVPDNTNDIRVLVEDAYKKSSAIFSGKVTEVTRHEKYVEVKFRTEKFWKGDPSREISFRTGFDDGDCGYQFVKGEKYVVYAYDKRLRYSRSGLETNLCTRTSKIKKNKDVKILNKIKKTRS